MSRRARRLLITFIVSLLAFFVLWVVFNAQPKRTATVVPPEQASTQTAINSAATQPSADSTAPDASPTTTPTPTTAPPDSLTGLRAAAALNTGSTLPAPVQSLGSLDPRVRALRLDFTRLGAGIASIQFSDIWQTANARQVARKYLESLSPSDAFDVSQLKQSERYILQSEQPFAWSGYSLQIPVLAAHSVVINGQTVSLLQESIWSQDAPGQFQASIVNDAGQPILEINRTFTLGPVYGFNVQQTVQNVSDQPLDIKWQQYGPPDLKVDRSGYIDRRRLAFGYLANPSNPRAEVLSGNNDFDLERGSAMKRHNNAVESLLPQEKREYLTIWPHPKAVSRGYALAWFASSNRYFGLAIHPMADSQNQLHPRFGNIVDEIRIVEVPGTQDPETLFTFLISPVQTVAPGATASFDMGVYAGPLDGDVLGQSPYDQLAMQGLILYQMSSCCTFLTFQWLAHLLLGFLSLLHDYVLFDWGLAIIALVIVVRSLLHPLTKKAQINMQRFGKKMGAMKPEIDKIQKKYAGDTKKAQQEQMRLMREHGVNPLQVLGCLPMFLQMPIWIALWAMLYLAFDIRQQPAFYGVFQLFNNWSFLNDLSSQDQFINLGTGFKIPLVGWEVTAINLLPLLMGIVFYIQQKYMSPPPTPNMTPEQIQQQKIMKVMMVVMFPLMLYSAPSGLTLYIFTSTCIGILESRYIRKHIDELDKNPPPDIAGGDRTKPKKPKDPRSRLFAEAIERAKAKRDEVQAKSFKKRK